MVHKDIPSRFIAYIPLLTFLLTFLASCGGSNDSDDNGFDYELERLWRLSSIHPPDGEVLLPQTTYEIDTTVAFPAVIEELKPPFPLSVTVGCNSAQGQYTLTGSVGISITLGPLTLRECDPDPILALDFVSGLEEADYYDARGAVLELTAIEESDTTRLKFIDENRLPSGSRELVFGDDSSVSEEQSLVIHSQEDFDSMWDQHCPEDSCADDKPTVDFETQSVIALFAGEKPLCECYIALQEFHFVVGGGAHAWVENECLPITHPCPAVVNYPFQILALPKFSDEVEFSDPPIPAKLQATR